MKEKSPLELAKLSLDGLTTGDSFGEQFFRDPVHIKTTIQNRKVPAPPWHLTDDSIMALGIIEILEKFGTINQFELARTFARNYMKDPMRGYGGMAHRILQEIALGTEWRTVSSMAFNGMGSLGNGGAMRAAPIGAYFSESLHTVVEQARLSAEVTHAHPEGQAGAIAVAVASAYVCSSKNRFHSENRKEILEAAIAYTPKSDTRTGIQKALSLSFTHSIESAVEILGNGSNVTAPDTVPFCLWCAARYINDFEEALWETVSGLGDRDTTCAIVGGIVALSTGIEGIPSHWLSCRESLTNWQPHR